MLYEKLDYVLAIAEEQNLTRAAKKLYISQPTLTMYLNRLEESLGVKLFDRQKTPIAITPAGRRYIEKMTEISEEEQILRGELRSVQDPAQTFRIGAARVRGHYWLPSLLRILSERHPDMNFVVSLGAERHLQRLLEKHSIDLALGSLTEIPSGEIPLVIESVSTERIILVAHKKYRLVPEEEQAQNSPDNPYLLNPEKLQNLPFIAPPPANGMYRNFQRMIGFYGIRPKSSIVVDMMTTGLMLTKEGLGIQLISAAILVSLSVQERQNLDYCVLPDLPQSRFCAVAWRKETELLPLIQETVNILKKDVIPQQPYTNVVPFPTTYKKQSSRNG